MGQIYMINTWCRKARSVSWGTHGSYFERSLLVRTVVAEATQRLVTTASTVKIMQNLKCICWSTKKTWRSDWSVNRSVAWQQYVTLVFQLPRMSRSQNPRDFLWWDFHLAIQEECGAQMENLKAWYEHADGHKAKLKAKIINSVRWIPQQYYFPHFPD